jgi:hypothetical protein
MFDGKMCTDYGLQICSFESNDLENVSSSAIELSTYKSPLSNKWQKYGYEYKDPKSFTIEVAKLNFEKFTKYEVGEINRWLVRTDGYHWFQLYNKNFSGVNFNCTATQSEELVLNGDTYGIKYTFTADSPYGYSDIIEKALTFTDANKSFSLIDYSDEIGHIYPDLKITCSSNGNLDLYNKIEDRHMIINNCTSGEIIMIDGEHKIITSSINTHKIYNDFNYKYFRIANSFASRENIITSSLNCIMEIRWREIRKVGI